MSDIKEKLLCLVEESKNDPEVLDFIERCISTYPEYVNAVVMEEYRTPLIRARKEGQDLRDAIEAMDATRRICHEAAIASCVKLNRLSEKLELEPFFEGDVSDRYAVADFCGEVVNEFYEKGTKKRERSQIIYEYTKDVSTFDQQPLDKLLENAKAKVEQERIVDDEDLFDDEIDDEEVELD